MNYIEKIKHATKIINIFAIIRYNWSIMLLNWVLCFKVAIIT